MNRRRAPGQGLLLEDVLFSQGFGARRLCAGLIQRGEVRVNGQVCTDTGHRVVPDAGLMLTVQGVDWPYAPHAYVMMHKPAGTECSQRPSAHPGVHTLLPSPLRLRPRPGGQPGVQAVGRLDEDTTGLLLLSDDGAFIHRMTSPRHHVPKHYRARVRHPLDDRQIQRLCEGVVLDDAPEPVAARAAHACGTHELELVLTEGRYHQVKRMVAAVGNRVESLHRFAIGGLRLDGELAPGKWRWLTVQDLALLRQDTLAPDGPPTV